MLKHTLIGFGLGLAAGLLVALAYSCRPSPGGGGVALADTVYVALPADTAFVELPPQQVIVYVRDTTVVLDTVLVAVPPRFALRGLLPANAVRRDRDRLSLLYFDPRSGRYVENFYRLPRPVAQLWLEGGFESAPPGPSVQASVGLTLYRSEAYIGVSAYPDSFGWRFGLRRRVVLLSRYR